MRFSGELDENYGETLILTSLRMLQDCPANGIPLRKVPFKLTVDSTFVSNLNVRN